MLLLVENYCEITIFISIKINHHKLTYHVSRSFSWRCSTNPRTLSPKLHKRFGYEENELLRRISIDSYVSPKYNSLHRSYTPSDYCFIVTVYNRQYNDVHCIAELLVLFSRCHNERLHSNDAPDGFRTSQVHSKAFPGSMQQPFNHIINMAPLK